eukprot:CAMPEP_0170492736 /NCGR_PEP_ID=MMETSP0208-20121228/12754_1 /TAXON_ID=197538 /ORGANISM="Strombidium inclinatum, Strain S3" /LENGTH=64 /DNA_ID=CAMNT_0010768527 /DNA_START=11 /DNA_END=205 /DNA_ORIENTATION=+
MERVTGPEAAKYYAVADYLHEMQKTCFNNCVVDYQNKDIGAMEKECSKQCIAKHMTIYKDMLKQ